MSLTIDKIHFTIIIPTRERGEVLKYALASACNIDYEFLTIIVSDNFSNDNTEEIVKGFSDSRIKYINTGIRVGMSQNWEFALSHVQHGWVTILGDDDAILPWAIDKVLHIIKKTGTYAIKSNTLDYAWPNYSDSKFGKLIVIKKIIDTIEVRSSTKWLQSVLDGNNSYTELPVLYNGGFVNIDVIKKIKGTTSKFYLSMTPDVYSGIAIALTIDSYVYCNMPLAINGASKYSGGTSAFSANKQMPSDDTPAMKFWNEPNIKFNDRLIAKEGDLPPRSIQALVFEAFLQSTPLMRYNNIHTTLAKQLIISIENSGAHYNSVIEWALKLIECRNMQPLKYKTYFTRIVWLLMIIKSFLKKFRIYVFVGNNEIPLCNVFEASLYATTLIKSPRNIFANIIKRSFAKYVKI